MDSRMNQHDVEIKRLKEDLEETKQYIKMNNLLFFNFKLPTGNLTSLQYSEYMADQINKLLPNLAQPVSWQHIDDAHRLRTRNINSNVIIVRFCNRNIRHEIYSQRASLPEGMYITEHLTQENRKVLNRAHKLFGYDNVYTQKCNIYIRIYNQSDAYVKTVRDVNNLFHSLTNPPSYSVPPHAHYAKRSKPTYAAATKRWHVSKHYMNNHRVGNNYTSSHFQYNHNNNYFQYRPNNVANYRSRQHDSVGNRHPNKQSSYSVRNRSYDQNAVDRSFYNRNSNQF